MLDWTLNMPLTPSIRSDYFCVKIIQTSPDSAQLQNYPLLQVQHEKQK